MGCLFFSPFSTSLISGCEHFLNTQTQEPTCPGEEKKAPIQIPGNLGEGDWAGRALPGPLLAVWIWTLKGGMKVGEPATPPPHLGRQCAGSGWRTTNRNQLLALSLFVGLPSCVLNQMLRTNYSPWICTHHFRPLPSLGALGPTRPPLMVRAPGVPTVGVCLPHPAHGSAETTKHFKPRTRHCFSHCFSHSVTVIHSFSHSAIVSATASGDLPGGGTASPLCSHRENSSRPRGLWPGSSQAAPTSAAGARGRCRKGSGLGKGRRAAHSSPSFSPSSFEGADPPSPPQPASRPAEINNFTFKLRALEM